MNKSPSKTLLMVFVLLATLPVPFASYGQSKLYVTNNGSFNISVVDTQTEAVINTIPSPGPGTTAIAYNPVNNLVYLPVPVGPPPTDGYLYLIDPNTDSFVGSPVAVGPGGPIRMSISPELNRGLVSNYYGDVSVIDTTTNTVIANIATGYLPGDSAFLPALGKAYVANNGDGNVSVIDVATNTVIKNIGRLGVETGGVGVDTVAGKVVVTLGKDAAVVLIDAVSDTVVATLPGLNCPQESAVDSTTHRAYVTYLISAGGSSNPCVNIVEGRVAVIDTVANAIVTTFPLGENPNRMALNVAENRLYVPDGARNSVFVVDTTTDSILSEIPVGTHPADIVIVPTSLYQFTGFYQPVNNLPTLNTVQAGRAVPVKFSLNGDQGLDIFADGYPKSQVINCNNFAPLDAIEETVTAGGSSLSYDAATDQYSYIWKTNKAWAGTCRQLSVRLNDDTDHTANFKFK